MDEKDTEYAISEVSELTGYPPHVLRYYEKEFELEIPRNQANHRYYTYKEIETLKYIKSLQEKGFTNKQIKLILNSPEILVNNSDETAVTTASNTSITNNSLEEFSSKLEDIILNHINPKLMERENNNLKAIDALKEEVVQLREDLNSKERDVLICENAKLKMKVKEKSYELAKIKEKLNKEQESNKGFLKKIFSNRA
ncbi:MerR family transcriptional regulator [Dethiothermospora halolimnae]|uniref:MerR family transcriptional regulator n=1 Tax=Dethiothermospora halolimnae TaxID=3114390 RepID=UPI003CCBCB47